MPDGKVRDFADRIPGFVQLKVGPDSNLYYANILTGQIMRFRYIGDGNVPPTAVAKATPTSGLAPFKVDFSGDASFDPDGELLTYNWSFGDGGSDTSSNPTHIYTTDGTYTAVLTVTDTSGLSHSDSVTISVGNLSPTARIKTPVDNGVYSVGEIVNFSGTGTDSEDGELTGDGLKWEVVIHHNTHLHYDYFHGTGNSGGFTFLDHEDDSYLELCLTATDGGGLQDKGCIAVLPRQVAYTFDTVPSGLDLTYSGRSYTTPFTVKASVGGQRSIAAPEMQSDYKFVSWSDGNAAGHGIVIQDVSQKLIAAYRTDKN